MLQKFRKDKSGGVAIYVAFFSMLAMSAGSISIDLGRLVTLKAQMQHRADAGATAGAVHLDGSTGAMQRASDVASNATTDESNIFSGGGTLPVSTVNFYSEYSPTKTSATTDFDAKVIEVIMQPKLVDFFFTPFLSMLINQSVASSKSITASAVAQYAPTMCHAPPLMVCDLTEIDGEDVMDDAMVGRQLMVKFPQGGNSFWAPGNFGLLESGYGSGANNLERSLADVEPPGCVNTIVTTEPGTMANRVKNGINARFNDSGYYTPAPNVQTYPRDRVFDESDSHFSGFNDRLGKDDWDRGDYWAAQHYGKSLPPDLSNATRYQTYLYELGEPYAAHGKLTIYPVPGGGCPGAGCPGYSVITPDLTLAGLPKDGSPDWTPASNGAVRRVMQVAVLQCVADEVRGRGDYSTNGNYIEVFITEPVGDPPDTSIYGEIMGRLTPDESMSFHYDAHIIE
ncbi:MAG: hypothetical protein E2O92_01880 [Alphaproteobacteria bacterium]|nr:MAG: hypothetical protein E2O92_01880 [Alphaproteobacteria bacterium]